MLKNYDETIPMSEAREMSKRFEQLKEQEADSLLYCSRVPVQAGEVECIIREIKSAETPVAMTLSRYVTDHDGQLVETNDLRTDGTLYFDKVGQIVDRAPAQLIGLARDFQDMYAGQLRKRLAGTLEAGRLRLSSSAIMKLIAGFFKGEAGIQRETVMGDGRKLIRSDL